MIGEKIFSYSPDNASAATLSEDDSDDDLSLPAVKEILLSDDNQQELTEIRNTLHNHRHYETELHEWINRDDELSPLYSGDSVSIDETDMDKSKVKDEAATGSFKTCIKLAEANGGELGTLHTLRLMRE
ncbi:hypothetical protein QE152_g9498 [Popillia japonica]|uniref:Uncharacterized protein n=1 Tax=Popillia japonica TaxID=7064 RepID=A0AAW1LUJ8_POPJA